MAFVKGDPKPPGSGRKKGQRNKSTVEIQDAIKRMLNNNSENIESWLKQVADEDPYKALNILQSFCDYAVPKLQRTDVNQKVHGGLNVIVSLKE
jgi:hypothetical protein